MATATTTKLMIALRNLPIISWAGGSPEPMVIAHVRKSGMPKMPSRGVMMSATSDAMTAPNAAAMTTATASADDIPLEQEVAELLDHDSSF